MNGRDRYNERVAGEVSDWDLADAFDGDDELEPRFQWVIDNDVLYFIDAENSEDGWILCDEPQEAIQ